MEAGEEERRERTPLCLLAKSKVRSELRSSVGPSADQASESGKYREWKRREET